MDATQLSPLDQIRLAEAEITRKIAAAREFAEQVAAKARLDATACLNQSREDGQHAGQTRYREIITGGEEEASALIAQGQQQAENLRRRGDARMQLAIQSVVNIIIDQEGDA